MLLLIVTGVIGGWFHVQADLLAGNMIVLERFLRECATFLRKAYAL